MDILLNSDGDIKLDGRGDIILANSIVQAIQIRLQWFLGEWRWNKEYGLPYFEKLFQKKPNRAYFEGLVKQEILSVEGIVDATVSITQDATTREGLIKFVAYTADGETIKKEVMIRG